jgi:trehalose-phosphatase
MTCSKSDIENHVAAGKPLWLFLDYDGTLADFASTPDEILPDPQLIRLIQALSKHPSIRVSIISGRRLSHIEKLVPVPGIILAGTYGIELLLADSKHFYRVEYELIRPALDIIKPAWYNLIANEAGFYLEDKDWAIALHAKNAEEQVAERVLQRARDFAIEVVNPETIQILGGHKFLEVGSRLSNKGETVRYLIEEYPYTGAKHLFIGDDDKDEKAFEVIKEHKGCAVRVSRSVSSTLADWQLPDPTSVRTWLNQLIQK